ncbi:sialate O-acetylesterase [Pelagicoccus sp. SDUM812005]|uniref:sialate O-acetylesterase n=1 Tax=Pelagicoccus sp. SDUM812005 TaxID=3041257 RepID=UPI00280D7CB1|nr:sialate O-acetylesterase [Pelagicoccus sp. SDUM812005]MDQ8181552.1 sialate O-acetylesterase [Pelagicoccus sp. SDUM812005]
MPTPIKSILCSASLALAALQALQAEVRLNSLFSDGMVVQRETEIPIWGWADAGETVSITASWGASAQTTTNADGTWKTSLATPAAGGPFEITIAGENEIVLDDVLSGEVWFCGGQSNMDFAMNRYLNDAREAEYQPVVEFMRKEVATAVDNWIRHIEVPQTPSLFEKKSDFDGQWLSVKPGQTEVMTATGYFFAKELRKELNVPIGLVECSWGGTRIQPWISEETYRKDPSMSAYFDEELAKNQAQIDTMDAPGYVDTAYEKALKRWKENGSKGRKPSPTTDPRKDRQTPATLYNGMLSAVIPYKIKGALWYQGESNASYMTDEYEQYLAALVNSWREEWGQGAFPFYWVQLAGYNAGELRDIGWAEINDQLRRGLQLPNTGMAVAYDIGEAKDIHPHNKYDVGKRLSLWALGKDYGVSVPAISGPLYKNSKVKGRKLILTFDEVGSGLMVGKKELMNETVPVDEALQQFEIAGKDGVWKNAQARIVSKNKVELTHPEIKKPVKARYAWEANPEEANLYNKEGLPASVFTTE